MVVQRLTVDEKILTASEHFEDDSALPLPAQMFRFGAEEVMDNTEDFSYSLLSLNSINKKNGPGSSRAPMDAWKSILWRNTLVARLTSVSST